MTGTAGRRSPTTAVLSSFASGALAIVTFFQAMLFWLRTFGACDYRIRFTKTAATQIDGVGLAADCVLAWYGAIESYSAAPYTYGIIGQSGIVACFLSTSAIHTNFVVW